MSSIDFTDSVTVVPSSWLDDVDQVVYEQHGVGKTTVASATTPDIFAATVGNFIDYTGTATCTGFVAAVSAGSHRVLYCADACLFTAGANLLIEGIPSGTTITLAAGAIVKVYAITTTQFKMTYSVSGTCTLTSTHFTVTQNVTAKYSCSNGVANLYIPTMTGTSNSTSFNLTGLPAPIIPKVAQNLAGGGCMDNSVDKANWIAPQLNGSLIISETDLSVWTASGTKQLYVTCITYYVG